MKLPTLEKPLFFMPKISQLWPSVPIGRTSNGRARSKSRFLAAVSIFLLGGQVFAQSVPSEASLAQVNSVLWTQQSVEHQAASAAMYRAASIALLNPSKLVEWASLEKGPATSGRKAIVMDIDETVLDNSAYNAWLVKANEKYDESTWQKWVALRKATAIHGALEFTKLAKRMKIDVFFVTNRECVPVGNDLCPALEHTRQNLLNLGFDQASNLSALMLKKQKPDWNASDKSSRRQLIAETHKIIMLVGDDMGDFLPTAKVAALREGKSDIQTDKVMKQLGKSWFVVPNPMYGSWEKVLPKTPVERIAALSVPDEWRSRPPTIANSNLRIATWNMAWLANDILTSAQAQNCVAEAAKNRNLDDRPSVECRKGAPFRQVAEFERMAKHAKILDADIVGIQEIQGLPAIQKIFDGDLPAASGDAGSFVQKGTYFLATYSQGGWQKVGVAIRRSILDPNTPPVVKDFVSLGDALERDKRGGLEVAVTLKNGSKLTILSVHMKSRCVEEALDANTPHCTTLAKQVPVLGAWIAQKELARERYIVLGDFNRSFTSSAELACSPANGDCKQKSFGAWIDGGDLNAAPIVLPTANLKHPAGCFSPRYNNTAIEHILLGGGAESLLVPQSVKTVPYLDPATSLPIVDHRKTVELFSDHCVVTVDMKQ